MWYMYMNQTCLTMWQSWFKYFCVSSMHFYKNGAQYLELSSKSLLCWFVSICFREKECMMLQSEQVLPNTHPSTLYGLLANPLRFNAKGLKYLSLECIPWPSANWKYYFPSTHHYINTTWHQDPSCLHISKSMPV